MTFIKTYISNVSALDNPSLFMSFYETMDKKRKDRIDCFKFQKDKNLSLGAGVLLKLALEKEGIVDFIIQSTKKGKPYLAENKALFFNLSHSGEIAMCTLASCNVGCDVEKIKSKPPNITRMFVNEQEDKNQFYKLWTAKESYLKMTGDGFFKNPKDIVIKLPFGSQVVENKAVTFFDLSMAAMSHTGKSYQITVCAEGEFANEDIKVETVDLSTIC